MAGIDRRISRSKQREKRRLRLPQMKCGLVVAVGGDPFEVPIPGFARIDAEFGSRLTEQHVPSALDILRGERLSVVPAHILAQPEAQLGAVFIPRPAGGEVRHDRLQCILRHVLVEDDEVIEHRHHWRDRRNRELPRGSTCWPGCRDGLPGGRRPVFGRVLPRPRTLQSTATPRPRVRKDPGSFPLVSLSITGQLSPQRRALTCRSRRPRSASHCRCR